jgi:Amt family ammonium transporter
MVPAQIFPAQASSDVYIMQIFYIIATTGAMMAVFALMLLDAGLANARNVMDTIVQKVLCAMIGGVSFMVVGYAVWNWQFYQALGVEHAFAQAVKDWSLFGSNLTVFSQHLDPTAVPQADFQQLFALFFFAFGGLVAAFIHGAGLERMKPLPAFIMAALGGGVFLPATTYLTWGSASPLTNAGLHDFVGSFSLYIFVGIWSLVLAWRLGPRRGYTGVPGNFALVGAGTFVLFLAIPMVVIGCGYLVPGKGYFGVTETESGLGIVFTNVFMALGGGALSGAVLAYARRTASFALLGPIAGYVSCTALYDIALPWQAFCISLAGPFILLGGLKVVARLGIDEPKIAPLALGPAVYSVLVAGIVGVGRPTGGMMGVTRGAFAFQHAHISLGMQALGLVIMIPATAVVALAVVLLLEKTIGLRVSAAEEDAGLDVTYWRPRQPAIPSATEEGVAPDYDHLVTAAAARRVERSNGIQRANR